MRIKLALVTGAALVVLGTGGAAYAVVAEGSVNPTTTGNVLPIDDNHSPITTTSDDRGRSPEPGDDRGGATTTGTVATGTTGDDHGRSVEPGDDRVGGVPTTRTGTAATTTATTTAAGTDDHGRTEPGDDHGAAAEPGDDHGHGHGGDDAAAKHH
jgi:hypothetical protein